MSNIPVSWWTKSGTLSDWHRLSWNISIIISSSIIIVIIRCTRCDNTKKSDESLCPEFNVVLHFHLSIDGHLSFGFIVENIFSNQYVWYFHIEHSIGSVDKAEFIIWQKRIVKAARIGFCPRREGTSHSFNVSLSPTYQYEPPPSWL